MNQQEKRGKLIVITGPSGVGKGTIVKQLLAKHSQIFISTSATTRKPREGEIHGQDYFFLSQDEFKQMIDNSQLLEWAEYNGNYYGTPKQPVIEQIEQGKIVILEIEVLGARQVKETFPDALRIFILPPSEAELERRLRGRGTDSESAIIKRLEKAKFELSTCNEFDYQVINDQLENAIASVEKIITGVRGSEFF
ncbi:guanylate kinase [Cyanobacterium aponinum UTEX 3222]|uniref:Guanylate kinase n=2 Tax=Cyanobacterium aponinum TaxID=379064 RepID=A0A844GUJ0_9CHRO|nr:guanylate kinase [Cyanobacterium aponinum]MTF38732.1 guanylate kinase [Cyanobacterium aponinum 0216]WPF88987.1 guanylate kinase [Cyanobacterium aponinum AL20115]WRL37337.1 guanylate kinase [Cyanobacterium aponinum UTEX 3221]WRL43696.1 guanylate kinase [Cyanobacterium aponinum UTEX 3222]